LEHSRSIIRLHPVLTIYNGAMSSQSGEDLGFAQFSKDFAGPEAAKATQWILELYNSDAKLFTKEMLDSIEDGLEKNKSSAVRCSAYATIRIMFKELKC
jgi:hypothetical protein